MGNWSKARRCYDTVSGSVRKSGARIRITAQLVDVASDRPLWSDSYDRQLTDVFAIQDEISASLVMIEREVDLTVTVIRMPRTTRICSTGRWMRL